MARALRAWAIHQRGKNSVRNLQYGPRTRLVRSIYELASAVPRLRAVPYFSWDGKTSESREPRENCLARGDATRGGK